MADGEKSTIGVSRPFETTKRQISAYTPPDAEVIWDARTDKLDRESKAYIQAIKDLAAKHERIEEEWMRANLRSTFPGGPKAWLEALNALMDSLYKEKRDLKIRRREETNPKKDEPENNTGFN